MHAIVGASGMKKIWKWLCLGDVCQREGSSIGRNLLKIVVVSSRIEQLLRLVITYYSKKRGDVYIAILNFSFQKKG